MRLTCRVLTENKNWESAQGHKTISEDHNIYAPVEVVRIEWKLLEGS